VDQNYLINLVSGLFGSKRQVETPIKSPVYVSDVTGLTGVDRYLKSKEVAPVLSGVARYMKNLEELASENQIIDSLEITEEEEVPSTFVDHEVAVSVSSVDRYLEKLNQFPVSSVAKYMARKALLAKNAPKISGVTKYMAKNALVTKKYNQPLAVLANM